MPLSCYNTIMLKQTYHGSYSAGVAVSIILKQHGYRYIDPDFAPQSTDSKEYSWYLHYSTRKLVVLFNDPQVETLLALQGDLKYA